jgi:phage shock protein A
MIWQIIPDMENQLIQVKMQVAISIADQHMLEKKLKESHESEQQWLKPAEMALDKRTIRSPAPRGRAQLVSFHRRELRPAGGRSESAGREFQKPRS